MEGTNRSGERGDKSLLCDPGSDIRLRGREKKKGRDTINKWDEKKKKRRKKKNPRNFPGSELELKHILTILSSPSTLKTAL